MSDHRTVLVRGPDERHSHSREDAELAIKPEHKMTLARLRAELEPMGFAFVESLEFLPDQRIVIFTRDDARPPARVR